MLHAVAVSAVLLLAAVGVSAAQDQQTHQPPHLILIVADDLGWNDISWHNSDVISPNLGQLAREGIILENSYVQPICTPTRSALMSSRYPFTIGRQNNVIEPFCPTGLTLNTTILPQELKKLGYDTHIAGKWHLGYCKWEYTATYRGFDTFHGFYHGSEHYYTHLRTDSMVADHVTTEGTGYDYRNNTEVDFASAGDYSTFVIADAVENIIMSRDPATPLFMYVPFQSVHNPMEVPEEYSNLYSNVTNDNRRMFLGMVTAMDDAVGQIVTALKSSGHYNNSVIVFTTDNGGPNNTANNWPLRGHKGSVWEGGTRGPAFIHSPLLSNPGTVSHRMVHVTDWYPTFVRLAGGSPPSDIDGVNQWEALNNNSLPPARDYFVYDIDRTDALVAAIRSGDYKLLVGDIGHDSYDPPSPGAGHPPAAVNTGGSCKQTAADGDLPTMQLYNITGDPSEREDLSASQPSVVKDLWLRLQQEFSRYVTKDTPPDDAAADPKNFGGVWSPGWC